MKKILLICGSFSSANYHVMQSVIRSFDPNAIVYSIAACDDIIDNTVNNKFYTIYNWRRAFYKWTKNNSFLSIGIILRFIITRFFGIWDNLFTSKYERRIFRKSRELVESNQIQYVFSVCKPFYAHRIAKKIQNKYGIIWYQFWVDPYSKTFRNVLGLSKLLANNFEKQYIEHSDKVFSLPEVFSDAEISGAKNRINRFEIPYVINRDVSYKGKDIIFAGSFIKRLREPAPVLNLILDSLSLLDHDVRFLFFVKNRTQLIKYEELSKGRIVFKDFIPHDSLYELLRDSYMLLNIGNAGSIQMPSKTVEYVSFRKPLLFFFSDKNDASLRYLNPYPDICMVNVNDDSESNIKKLVAFINAKHIVLSYEELMKIPIYYESTPEYVSSLMS